MKASVSFIYTLERSRLNLTVSEAALQLPEKARLPVLLFSGNFDYNLAAESSHERLNQLTQVIASWQIDLNTYLEIINQRFLQSGSQTPQLTPDLLTVNAAPALTP